MSIVEHPIECECYKCHAGRYYISPERRTKMEKQIKGLREEASRLASDQLDKDGKQALESLNVMANELQERLDGKVYCPCCLYIPEACKCTKEELLDCAIQLDGAVEDQKVKYENELWDRVKELRG